MSDLLVGVGKGDQLPFGPGAPEELKTYRQVFADETHRHNDDRPLSRRTDEGELALRRLATVTVYQFSFNASCTRRGLLLVEKMRPKSPGATIAPVLLKPGAGTASMLLMGFARFT
jgi:hypothetical protein